MIIIIEFLIKKPESKIHPIHFLNKLLYKGYEKLDDFYESSLWENKDNTQPTGTLYISDYREEYDEFMIHFSCKNGIEPMSICFLVDESSKRKVEMERIINSIQNHAVLLISKMSKQYFDEAAATVETKY